jgi:hypothetical protein
MYVAFKALTGHLGAAHGYFAGFGRVLAAVVRSLPVFRHATVWTSCRSPVEAQTAPATEWIEYRVSGVARSFSLTPLGFREPSNAQMHGPLRPRLPSPRSTALPRNGCGAARSRRYSRANGCEASFLPAVGFAIWHFAPQTVFANTYPGGASSLVIFALLVGLSWGEVVRRTGRLRTVMGCHVLLDFSGLGARLYLS